MAINVNPGTPLRHVATYTATGNWTAPLGTTVAFVAIHGATGGGGAGSAAGAGTSGTANTGGGGGGGGYPTRNSGAGGSGVVIIRYQFQ